MPRREHRTAPAVKTCIARQSTGQMAAMIRTRFSPNGLLHLGHAYAAVVAHDLARARGGNSCLGYRPALQPSRRSNPGRPGLAGCAGVGRWHPVGRRRPIRWRAEDLDLLYPAAAPAPKCWRRPPAWGRTGRSIPARAGGPRGRFEGAAWRLDMAKAVGLTGPLEWTNELAGVQHAQPEAFGDVVLLRKEAPPAISSGRDAG